MRMQSKMLLGDSNGVVKSPQGKLTLMNHKSMETYLGRYSGLLLYLKEMDEAVYAKLCAVRLRATCYQNHPDSSIGVLRCSQWPTWYASARPTQHSERHDQGSG